jgi:TRAP-type C4-dicarboxylate transport system permease large subunit
MFLMCRLGEVRIEEFSRELIPFLLAILVATGLVIVFPEIVVWLPNTVLD